MTAAKGTVISYATAPGKIANEESGRDGLYTECLVRHLRTPGLGLRDVLMQTRVDVAKASQNTQVPWENSSLMGEFYFLPSGSSVPVLEPPTPIAMVGHIRVATDVPNTRVTIGGEEVGHRKSDGPPRAQGRTYWSSHSVRHRSRLQDPDAIR